MNWFRATIDNINNKVGSGGQQGEFNGNLDNVKEEIAAIKAMVN